MASCPLMWMRTALVPVVALGAATRGTGAAATVTTALDLHGDARLFRQDRRPIGDDHHKLGIALAIRLIATGVRDRGVEGSNPFAPTNQISSLRPG